VNYLVISDIHANAAALEAVLAAEDDWDEVVCLGDTVDGGPHPNRVLDRLSELPGTFLIGDHGRGLLTGTGEISPDRRTLLTDPDEMPPPGRRNISQWTRLQLTDANVSFMEGFSETETLTTRRGAVRLHHGDFNSVGSADALAPGPDETKIGLDPTASVDTFVAVGDLFEEPTVLFGHSHAQFDVRIEGPRFLNPGSVGRSFGRGISAQYATLDDGEVRLKEIQYDAEPTIEAMESLPVDDDPTTWQRCLKWDLYRLRSELGRVPDRTDVSERGRYEPVHYLDAFESWEEAIMAPGPGPGLSGD